MHRKKLAKFLSFALAMTLIAEPVAGFMPVMNVSAAASTVSGNGTVSGGDITTEAPKANAINLEEANTSLWVGGADGWGNSAASVTASGTKATIEIANTGSEGSEWQLQYMVNEMGLVEGKQYTLSFDITSTEDKKVLVKLDDSGIIVDTLELKAGEKITYNKTITMGAVSNDILYFALGQMAGETGGIATDVTIENLVLEENKCINFENAKTNLWVGGADGWGNSAATVTPDGTSTVVDIANIGSEGSEWQIQYMVEELGLEAGENYIVSFDITSTIDKDIFFKVDDSGAVAEAVSLKAGEKTTYTKAFTAEEVKNDILYFAVGQMEGEEGGQATTITISDLKVAMDVATAPDPKGPEYDFSAVSENSVNDYADPGKTKEGYDLIWSDEFDGNYGNAKVDAKTGLNLDNWAPQYGDGSTDCGNQGWGNKELQAYTDNKKNLGVNEDLDGDGNPEGVLRITGSYEADGYDYAEESTKNYTSARIRTTSQTQELFNTTYGYVEARMSLPATKGAWPAFWMLPQSTDIYGGWPVSGEIDILETCGSFGNGNNRQGCGTLHYGAPEHVYKGMGYVQLDSDYNYFHTYAIDWEPGKITWYYDGVAKGSMENWTSGFANASDALTYDAPFDQPYYILLNLAIDSGQFGGNVNKATFRDDINMYVDYVRVFQKTDGYADSVERTASEGIKDDWANYAGQNQIAEIKADNLITNVPDGNLNAVETSAEGVDSNAWYLAYQGDATDAKAETVTDTDGKTWAKVGVTTPGSQDYSVQLIGHYDAKANYVYKVSFDAYADGDLVGKTVNCDSKEWKSWSTYAIKSFDLKDEPTNYSYIFEQTEDFEDCRIEFNVGAKGSGNVYVGNVKVEIIDPAILGEEENKRVVLSDGNLIYNSTFDQGSERFGYWEATTDTTVNIPRYTTTMLGIDDVSVVDIASKTNWEDIADGVKYYERRAQVSAEKGKVPTIYQNGLNVAADDYTLTFDMYSEKNTTVTAALYTVDANGAPDKELVSTTTDYKAIDGLKNYTWKFATEEARENVALVLSFGDGANVQVDNVVLKGATQGDAVDPTPMTPETTWVGDNGSGGALEIKEENGVYSVSGFTSGATWYSPQIISSDYALSAGKTYEYEFKYKLEGESNNTLDYIVQENSGSWTVFVPQKGIIYDAAKADEDGFCTYKGTFVAENSLKNVHFVFGLGNSEAAGKATFSFKDVVMNLVEVADGEEDGKAGIVMPQAYAIAYVLDGGVNAANNPLGYTKADGTLALATPTKEGYNFLGWTVGSTGTNYVTSVSTNQEGTITLYANWKAVEASTPSTSTPSTGGSSSESQSPVVEYTVKLNAKSAPLQVKKSTTAIKATVMDGDKVVSWKSDKPSVANVNNKGKITAKKVGTAKITVTTEKGATATVTIKVQKGKVKTKSVSVTNVKKNKLTLKKGAKFTLATSVNPITSPDKLKFNTSDKKIVAVTNKGKLTAKKTGKAKITVTSGSKKKVITVTVK